MNTRNFDTFLTLAEILKETETGTPLSQLIPDLLSQLSKESDYYFPTTKDPQDGKERTQDPSVKKPGKSTLSMLEEDQQLKITNDNGL